MKFKNDFLWGASSAAYQIEGAFDEDGRGKTSWDVLLHLNQNISFENANGDVAADHYHRYQEDVKLMSEMGMQTYRFSIAWTRIFPNGDFEINDKGLEFYRKLISELKKYNIKPVVTIHHFDTPLALEKELDDWATNPEFVNRFVHFAKTLFNEFGKDVKHWIIINEPNGYAMMTHRFGMINKERKGRKHFYNALFQLALAHAKVIEAYKQLGQDGLIGSSIAEMYSIPLDESEKNIAAHKYHYITEFEIVHDIFYGKAPSPEFIKIATDEDILPNVDLNEFSKVIVKNQPTLAGTNYYQTMTIASDESDVNSDEKMKVNNTGKKGEILKLSVPGKWQMVHNPNMTISDWGWSIHPSGLTDLLVWIEKRYSLPVIITENGLGAKDVLTDDDKVHDDYRIDYLRLHIDACANAIAKGSKLFSYNPWSVIDLFSWMNGYQKRYGFVYVNRTENDLKDLRRIKKDSFYWYKKVISTNGEDLK